MRPGWTLRLLKQINMPYNDQTVYGESISHIRQVYGRENLWWAAAIWNLSWDWQAGRTGGILVQWVERCCSWVLVVVRRGWQWQPEHTMKKSPLSCGWGKPSEFKFISTAFHCSDNVTAQWLILTARLPLTADLWHMFAEIDVMTETLSGNSNAAEPVTVNCLLHSTDLKKRHYLQPSSWQQCLVTQ
jgi:hypothetical protein